ncbi:MAG: hypothetical protein JXA45_04375 [Methanomassiliicoccales archaeon]|nr:hypothetical protein [Methanomassiliicoccales archaeon]
MAEVRCACEGGSVIVYPCSGAANLGQAYNEMGLRLMEQGRAIMSCLAGVGATFPISRCPPRARTLS